MSKLFARRRTNRCTTPAAFGLFLLSLITVFLLAGCSGDTVSIDGLFGGTDAGVDATTTITDAGGADADAHAGDAALSEVTLGGVVIGLAGHGLVIANGTDDLSIAANGTFTFKKAIADGAHYQIAVTSEPSTPAQTCSVTNGAGVAADANIVDVVVNCVTNTYALGGTVSGLSGTGLVLENEFGDDLSITQSGPFTFATKVPSGNNFSVSIKAQPVGQTCSVAGGAGTIGSADVTSVQVQCGAVGTYAISGQISGLSGTVVLQNNGGDNLTLTSNGTFAFHTTVAPGSLYAVSVLTQPTSPSQTCTVSAGVGVTVAAPTTSVRVVCVTNAFPISVNVTGLVGTGLVLQDNSGDNLSVAGNGVSTFGTSVLSGARYNVQVLTEPSGPAQQCLVTNGASTVGNGPPLSIEIACTTTTYAIKASVTGLTNTALTLTNGADSVTVDADGTYTFPTRLISGAAFDVEIGGHVGPAACSLSGNSGHVGTSDVTATINCGVNTYTVSGTISGLAGNVVLQNNGANPQTVSGTTFSFAAQNNGSPYSITVLTQPSSPSQTCTVTNGAGTLAGANVTNVSITCSTNTYKIGGTVYGLSGTGLVLDNGADTKTIAGTGTVSFQFPTSVASGTTYHVTVGTLPTSPAQTCSVSNGDGAVAGADVTNVTINCTTVAYTLSGTVSGLVGSGLYLQDNGTDTYQVLGNGTFSFATQIPSGGSYSLQVLQQPSSPTQSCGFTDKNGNPIAAPSGTIHTAADNPTIYVKCTTTSFNVGGTISGLAMNDSVTLLDNMGDSTVVSGNGPFHMNTPIASGSTYAISVGTQPASPKQTCQVSGGSGIVGSGAVTSVSVNCATNTYTVGGTLSGLAGGAVVLQDNNGDNLTLAANGTFAFATPIASGATYSATVLTNPSGPTQTCTIAGGNSGNNNGTGTIGTANDTSLVVTCTTTKYTVYASVTGLTTGNTVTLQNNGADTQIINANSPPTYAFATQVPSGNIYDVTVQSFTGGSAVSCTAANNVGVVQSANITVNITCSTSYSIGGTVSGLATGGTVVLQDNGGDNLSVNANGAFSFATRVVSGQMYAVSVLTNPSTPLAQTCLVQGTAAGVATSNVTNAVVTCTPPGTYAYLAAGSTALHECAIAPNGTLWCWGYNSYGELGDGSTSDKSSPEQIGTATTWSSVAVGGYHTCATRTNGTLWCWGANFYGQLGDGTTNQENSPEQIGTGTTWSSVSAGTFHTCALQTNGTLWCWGYNDQGELGDGSTAETTSPVQVGTATTWSSVSLGYGHTCGVKTNGTLWCWGNNNEGELGDGTTNNESSPEQVGTATTWGVVTAGAFHVCALQTNGTLWCWGDNDSGQLGDGTTNRTYSPERIGTATTWSSVSGGDASTCALQTNGTLWCWGDNDSGQLGDGTFNQENSPEQIGTATWTAVRATEADTYGLQGGPLFGWGFNELGDVGDGTTTQRNAPVSVP